MAEAENIKVKVTAEVDAKGAKETAKGLDSVAKSAKNAQKAFSKLSGNGPSSSWNKKSSGILGGLTGGNGSSSSNIKKVAEQTKKLGEATKKATPWAEKLLKNIGRIALYRAIRATMSAVTQSFNEGITNLRKWSNMMGTSFAPAMYSATAKFIEMKNAIAVAVAPILENVLIPLFEKVANAVITAGNAFSKFFAMLQGKSSYTKTLPISLAQAAKSLGDMKRTLLGFDELNVLNSDSGSSQDIASMFEIKAITDWFDVDFITAIKNLDFREAGTILGEKFNEAFANIEFSPEEFGKAVHNMIKDALDFTNGFLSSVDFYKIGETIVRLLKETFDNEDVQTDGLATSYGDFVGRVFRVPYDILIGAAVELWMNFKEYMSQYIEDENGNGRWDAPEIIKGIVAALKEGKDPILEAGESLMRSFWQGFIKPWNDVRVWIDEKVEWIVGKFNSVKQIIKDVANFIGVGTDGVFMEQYGATVNTGLKSYAWATVGSTPVGAAVLRTMGIDNPITSGLKNLVTAKADGGYVGAGSLFIAGENGAELIGGGTGGANVTNGNQLAESVAIGTDGLMNAVLSAAQSIVDAVGDINMNPQIDGMALARGLSPYQKKLASYNGMSLVQSR